MKHKKQNKPHHEPPNVFNAFSTRAFSTVKERERFEICKILLETLNHGTYIFSTVKIIEFFHIAIINRLENEHRWYFRGTVFRVSQW